MTRFIDSLLDVAGHYDAIVLDQWGVLHNGSAPYPSAVDIISRLHAEGTRLAVLSNSGKRAAPNAARIAKMGFPEAFFSFVMTSGEALWRDVASGDIPATTFFPIERAAGDAASWAEGLNITLTGDLAEADAILLMGLPDGSEASAFEALLAQALATGLPLYCSNPDRKSPREGSFVVSPGALAFDYAERGGAVRFYGKPHRPVYGALEEALGTSRLLMIGDSLEHDIAGAVEAGWDSLFIRGGIHAPEFASGDLPATLDRLVAHEGGAAPTYSLEVLQ